MMVHSAIPLHTLGTGTVVEDDVDHHSARVDHKLPTAMFPSAQWRLLKTFPQNQPTNVCKPCMIQQDLAGGAYVMDKCIAI